MSQLAEALEAVKLKIIKYDPSKQRPVSTSNGTMSIEKFQKILREKLGPKAAKFGGVMETLYDVEATQDILEEYAKKQKILVKDKSEVNIDIPADMQDLTLNMNMSAIGKDEEFFLTHEDETISRVSGRMYMLCHQMSPVEAASQARKVVPDYMPRGSAGVTEMEVDDKVQTIFNTYAPPKWTKYPLRDYKNLPDRLPPLFEKLVNHLFPKKVEREFFYAWLHDSIIKRSFTFLILCSAPGTGKNRLKLVMRALHGHVNTTDGKKSTLIERFNSQLSESTLCWFDELHYDSDMENVMKELQNDSISIERKGVDATKGTKIHASIVISNNKPRDNYIAFDARKFAPLVVSDKRLETSMSSEEIDELTQKVEDETSDTFDPRFLAQIVKWLKKNVPKIRKNRWPNLEYKGPMFWMLAHTSMTRWQKKAVMIVLEANKKIGYDPNKDSYLWSELHNRASRKNGDKSLQFPDFTSVKAFFDVFKDAKGKQGFETEAIPGANNLLGDFWVRPLIDSTSEIVTESNMRKGEDNGKQRDGKQRKPKYDL